jgi:diguanylate cyclase (GGDEF)-like protein
MKDESPLTGLPGSVWIQEEIERRMASSDEFALLLADLDSFKAFNDRYGFARGDDVIRQVAELMADVVHQLAPDDGFVGHLTGDDFVVVAPPTTAAIIADTLVERFDQIVPGLYDDDDRERGWIEVTDRRGEVLRFSPITMSIGIASTERRTFAHYAEVMAVATELRSFTKSTPGSSWVGDRRGPA